MRPLTHPHGAHLVPSRGLLAMISRSLQDLVEPVMKLMLEVMTAMILGFFFVVQSISIVVSLDLIVAAIIKSIQTGLYHLISWLTWCLASERERKAVGFALIDFLSNILWAEIICHLNAAIRRDFFFIPAVSYGVIFMMFTMFSTRLEVDLGDQAHQLMLFVMLIGQCAMFYVTALATTPTTVYMTLFLLKCNIDIQFTGLELLVKAVMPPKDMDNNVWFFISEILRRALWLGLTIHQTLLRERHDRGILLMLVFHDLLAVSMPIRKLIAKIKHDRIIAQRFASLSADELTALRDENCAVCLNEHNNESRRLPCGHVLHSGCLNRILQSTARGQHSRCPICRADIPFSPPASTSSSSSSNSASNYGAATGSHGAPHVNPMREIIRVRIITQGMLPAAMGLTPPASAPTSASGQDDIVGGNQLRQRRGGSALSQRILDYHQELQQQRQLHPQQQSQQAIYHSSGDLSEYSSGSNGGNNGIHRRRTHQGLRNIINPPRQSALSDLFGHSSYRSYSANNNISGATNFATQLPSSGNSSATSVGPGDASVLFSATQNVMHYSSDPLGASGATNSGGGYLSGFSSASATASGPVSAHEALHTTPGSTQQEPTAASTIGTQSQSRLSQQLETENSLDSLLQIMEESDEEEDSNASNVDGRVEKKEEEERQVLDILQQHASSHLINSSSGGGGISSDMSNDLVRRMTLVTPSEAAADLHMASAAYHLQLQREHEGHHSSTTDDNHGIQTDDCGITLESTNFVGNCSNNGMRSNIRDRRRKFSRRQSAVVSSETGTLIDSSDTDHEEEDGCDANLEEARKEKEEDGRESKRPRHT